MLLRGRRCAHEGPTQARRLPRRRSRDARAALAVLGAASLGAGIIVAGAPVGAAPAIPAGLSWSSKVPICHATDSSHFNYNLQLNSTSVNKAVTEESGHGATGIDAWDIIPAFDYTDANGQPAHFDGLNWLSIEPHAPTAADKKTPGIPPTGFTGQQIFENDCNADTATAAGGLRLTKVVADANGVPLADQSDGNLVAFAASVTQNNIGVAMPLTRGGSATLQPVGGTAAGATASVSTDPFTLLQGPVTFTVTETAPADSPYRLAGITCTVNNQPLNPSFDANSGSMSGTITFTPFIGQNVACTFVNQLPPPPPTYTATVLKIDPGAGPLAEAQFELQDATGAVIDDVTTGADGSASVSGLPAGAYRWVETAPPGDYTLPANPVTAFVLPSAGSSGDATTTVPNFPSNNLPDLFPVSVLKTDAEDGAPLSGASFVLCAVDANPCAQADQFGSVVTDGDGLGELSVPAGTYYWVETAPPSGYDPVGGTFEVIAGADPSTEPIDVPNTRTDVPPPPTPLYSVALRKTDLVTGDNLNGVGFLLCSTPSCDASGYVSEPITTHHVDPDVDGFAEVAGVPAGAYYWVETSPLPGYAPAAPVAVVVDESTGSVGTVIRDVARDAALAAAKSITAISGGGYQDDTGTWHYTAAGETIDYSVTAINRGGQPLTGVLIADELPGLAPLVCAMGGDPDAIVANGDLVLGGYDNNASPDFMNADGGNYALCTTSYVVTEADVDAGSITNAAYATGTPTDGGTPVQTPPSEATAIGDEPGPRIDPTPDPGPGIDPGPGSDPTPALAPAAGGVDAPPVAPPGPQTLASTGAGPAPRLAAGAGLITLGALLALLGMRRRRPIGT